MEQITCKNCGNEFEGYYCNHCGQKADIDRITFATLRREILDAFDLERGLGYTIKSLTLNAGGAIKEYLEGKRKRHYNPLKYLLLVAAITTFLQFNLLEIINPNELAKGYVEGYEVTGPENIDKEEVTKKSREIAAKFTKRISQLATPITLLLLPFLSFFSRRMFRKAQYNIYEHLVINTFVIAHSSTLLIPFLLGGYFYSKLFIASYLINILYMFWAYYKTFNYSIAATLFRVVIVVVASYVIILIIGFTVGIIAAAAGVI